MTKKTNNYGDGFEVRESAPGVIGDAQMGRVISIPGLPKLRRESYRDYTVRLAMEAHNGYIAHPERCMTEDEFKKRFNECTAKRLGLTPMV